MQLVRRHPDQTLKTAGYEKAPTGIDRTWVGVQTLKEADEERLHHWRSTRPWKE